LTENYPEKYLVLKRAKVKMESEREGRNSDFGILKGMWMGKRELRILGDGLKTWKLSVVKGMNVCWTQLHISNFIWNLSK